MIKVASNGQWTLAKSEEGSGPPPTTLHGLVGKTHTVEVHPHIDHLYRLKNHIQEQPKKSMQLGHIKKSEFGFLADKLPRDSKGAVTPEMIDKHIAGLPKHKVEVKVVPYKGGAQQHRQDVPEYVASVGMHPDTLNKMSPKQQKSWNFLKDRQHNLEGHEHQVGWARLDPYKVEGQRELDPPDEHNRRFVSKDTRIVPNEGHWHVDEIQSDFGVPKVLKEHQRKLEDPKEIADDIHRDAYAIYQLGGDHPVSATEMRKQFVEEHPELANDLDEYLNRRQKRKETHEAIHNKYKEQGLLREHNLATDGETYWNEEQKQKADKIRDELDANVHHWDKQDQPWEAKIDKLAEKYAKEREGADPADMHELLSHGHEDPMHMIHSAVNQLGRQNGIQSMSMDTPNHQAHQSGLRPSNQPTPKSNVQEQILDHIQNGGVSQEDAKQIWNDWGAGAQRSNEHDVHYKSAIAKLGPEGVEQFASLVPLDHSSWMFNGNQDAETWKEVLEHPDSYKSILSPEVRKKLLNLEPAEKDALSRFANDYSYGVHKHLMYDLGLSEDDEYEYEGDPDNSEYDLPVHQINTYDKRPKKLGFQTVDKESVLGKHPFDDYNQVQYAKLHKKLLLIQELLRKADG